MEEIVSVLLMMAWLVAALLPALVVSAFIGAIVFRCTKAMWLFVKRVPTAKNLPDGIGPIEIPKQA